MNLIQRAARAIARAAGLRAYDAGQADPRFRRSGALATGSANVEVSAAAQTVANSARDAVRNDAFAARIVDLWAANAVGAGITVAWKDKARADAWKRWAETTACDAEGRKTLGAIEALCMRAVVTDGEVLVRFVPRPPSARNPLGLVLQVLESDYLDRTRSGAYEGRAILQGVEINELGAPVAYWLYPRHPGESWPILPPVGLRTSVRVPASEVLHVFKQQRPGQVRGMSWLAPVLSTLRDLSDYEAALLMKAKIESCMTAVVSEDGDDLVTGQTGANRVTDSGGNTIETFEPGMILYRRGSGEIEVINPSGGGSHLNFARRALERSAVGAGLTYDQVSGDLTGANYSSLRAGKIEFRALNGQVQWTLLLPQLCIPVADAFDRFGELAGLWRGEGEVTHTPPSPEMVDPLKDTAATIAQVRAALLSPQRAAAGMGYQYEELIAEIKEANAMLDAAGLAVDSDTRRVAKSGVAHDARQIAAIEIAATGAAIPRAPEPDPTEAALAP